MKTRAQLLRQKSTDAENKLWQVLRNRMFYNFKFRRQYCIDKYIVDFVCKEEKLVIELDGGQHLENAAYDENRTKVIEQAGYKVIRFWNDEVLLEIDVVLESIYNFLTHPHPSLRDTLSRKREKGKIECH